LPARPCARFVPASWRVRLEPAFNLAVCRVVVCALVLGSSELGDAQRWLESGQALRAPPPSLAWALPLFDALTPDALRGLQALALLATTLALVGFRARWTLPLSALSALVLFALPHFSGGPRHSMHLTWLLGVLACSPSDAALRLPWLNPAPARSRDHALAVTLALWTLWALLAATYFFPGLWKLASSGFAWALSDNLQNQMYWKWCQFGELPSPRIDRHPALMQAGALGVLVFELGFPVLVFAGPRARLVAAALGLTFHLSAERFLFLPFSSLWGCYVALVDWRTLVRWLTDRDPLVHHVSLGVLAAFARRRPSRELAAVSVSAVIVLGGAVVQGARARMHSYPFACYPTFQWRVERAMPDLWIAAEHGGNPRWLKDSPALGGQRPQARWGMAWRALGSYGDGPSLDRLVGYYEALPEAVRGPFTSGDSLRFYRVMLDVTPDCRERPASELELIGEWRP
jgi:hypothetical protein